MIKYYRLFDLLNRRGMKKTDLLEIISAPTLAKLTKGQNVQTEVIDKICLHLGCQPSDIMEVIDVESDNNDGTTLIVKSVMSDIEEYMRSDEENEHIDENGVSVRSRTTDEEKLKAYVKKIIDEYMNSEKHA